MREQTSGKDRRAQQLAITNAHQALVANRGLSYNVLPGGIHWGRRRGGVKEPKRNSKRRSDPLTPAQRSYTMSRVRGKDTSAEMAVRRAVHRMGYRYSLRRTDLPGKPDLTFVSRRKAIFVHGCFWHGHSCKSGKKQPKSNQGYWLPKLKRNRERDALNEVKLRDLGWDVLALWECQLFDEAVLRRQLRKFLGRRGGRGRARVQS